jgi:monoglucosyldiacylglycerol epimerase
MFPATGLEEVQRWLFACLEGAVLFLLASIMFDVIHFTLHRFMRSRSALLRRIGGMHQAHHDFFTEKLQFDERFARANLIRHVIPEYCNQIFFTLPGYFLLGPRPTVIAVMIETLFFVIVVLQRGKDGHHIAASKPKGKRRFKAGVFVTADYHSLHHIDPGAFYSSYLTVFDRLMGTACHIQGRKVAITGASGAFGSAMAGLLEGKGALVTPLKHGVHFTATDASPADQILQESDILVLAHGAKREDVMASNCDSFVTLIERYRTVKPPSLSPVEVWAIGSESEAHPSFGDPVLKIYRRSKVAYARHARGYYSDRSMIYRHVVPSAFRSTMGPGLISAETAAKIALCLICRGARYVPVTYTGIALVNYFKFAWFTQRLGLPKPYHGR